MGKAIETLKKSCNMVDIFKEILTEDINLETICKEVAFEMLQERIRREEVTVYTSKEVMKILKIGQSKFVEITSTKDGKKPELIHYRIGSKILVPHKCLKEYQDNKILEAKKKYLRVI